MSPTPAGDGPSVGASPVRVLRHSAGRLRLALAVPHPDPSALEQAIRATPGVEAASYSIQTGNLLVTFDARSAAEEEVLAAVTTAVCPAPATPSRRPRRGAPPLTAPDGLRVVDVEPPAGWMAAEGSCLLRAAPSRCARVILDFAAYPEWQEYVTRVAILERDSRGRGSVVRTDGRVGDQTVSHLLAYRYPSPTRIAWEQLEGELEGIRGEWRLRSAGRAATRATYRLEVRPGLRLRLLLRGPLYLQVRDALFAHTLGELSARLAGP